MTWLSQKKQKELARAAANKAFGKASNYQVGQARKILVQMVDDDPKNYIDMHGSVKSYYTILSDKIIEDAAEKLKPASLF